MIDPVWHFWDHDCCPCCGDAVEVLTDVQPDADNIIRRAYDGDPVRCCSTDGSCTWTSQIMVDDGVEPPVAYLDEGSDCDCED